jgi:hypothetical protein
MRFEGKGGKTQLRQVNFISVGQCFLSESSPRIPSSVEVATLQRRKHGFYRNQIKFFSLPLVAFILSVTCCSREAGSVIPKLAVADIFLFLFPPVVCFFVRYFLFEERAGMKEVCSMDRMYNGDCYNIRFFEI